MGTILYACQQTDWKYTNQLVWYKTNSPVGQRTIIQSAHENILILATHSSHLKVKPLVGSFSHSLSVLGHGRVTHHSKDSRGQVLNSSEKPWALLYRLLYPRIPDSGTVTVVELCCGTAPVARAAAVLCMYIYFNLQNILLIFISTKFNFD